MKIFLLVALFGLTLTAQTPKLTPHYSVSEVPKHISVKEKKARYFALLVPPVEKVYKELYSEYERVQVDLNDTNKSQEIAALKKSFRVKTDRELLVAMKPHPVSITLAQGAIESAWGTSRFFREANNVFGMWNSDASSERIAANEKREGKHTIWLSKYKDLEASVRAYYRTLQKGKTYKKFRELNYETDNVFEIVKGLDKYSERGEEYTKELASMIRYNKLTKYDKDKK